MHADNYSGQDAIVTRGALERVARSIYTLRDALREYSHTQLRENNHSYKMVRVLFKQLLTGRL